MTTSEEAEARAQLARLPQLGEVKMVTRLGGLTNKVFRVDCDAGSICLRIPGKGTEAYINRTDEAQATWETARSGVSAALLSFNPASGVMVTRFLPEVVTMTPVLFKERQGAPARAGTVLKKLHTSGAVFNSRFELFAMIDNYLKLLAEKKAELPDGYHDVLAASQDVRAALAKHELPLAACHCDPLSENFLDNGSRMWLVDWEYSGMNDPMWDLGDVAVEAQFGEAQENEMIASYFGGEPRPAERGRIVIYKAMCDLLWTLWGLIQHADKNPADDFWAYSVGRFERCKALMATAEFPRHAAAIAKG